MASISSEQNTQPSPQLLFVGENDSKRLLEVFVKRSLSLNEGSPRIREHRSNKLVTIAEKQKRDRKHSSDTSLNLTSQIYDAEEDFREELFTQTESEKKVDTPSEKMFIKLKIKASVRRKNGSDASQKSNSKPKKWFQREKGKEDDGPNHEASPFQTHAVEDGHSKTSNKLESSTEERKIDGSDMSQKVNSKPKKWFLREKGNEDDRHNHEALPFQTNVVGDGHTKMSNKLESSTEERKIDGSDMSQKFNSKSKKWFLREKGNEDGRHNHEALPFQTNVVGDGHTKMSNKLESSTEERKSKESKKQKKPTVWKSFLNWLTKGNQEKEQEVQTAVESPPSSTPPSPQISCLPLYEKGDIGMRRSKSMKKRQSRGSMKWRRSGDMSNVENGKVIEMVEPTNCYYEKVSEELEKIVHEVKDSPADGHAAFQPTGQNGVKKDYEDVIKRITEVIKQEGDFIDDKIKDNTVVSSFLEGFSYRSFQQMADQYVQSEVPDKETKRPVVAPELVKFAFTLDFTARVANLHHLATGQIMGFGNQYLQDRFTHMSESHPHLNDTRTDGLKSENLDQDYPSI
nr:uncharacterized protein LOC129451109 isoform X1 [Misgurnus anguillicaudatus]XP_055070145.1 uncharacterized protein LOC129451109 isoform X1 [Misgurnus anguillicaudatus]